MKIDLDHLHYWMCAIRESHDSKRTLDAFWKGQIDSKLWLIKNLESFIDTPVNIDINGGWVGVLASLLFQSNIPIKNIKNIDIDPTCEPVARMMNKIEEMQGRFTAITEDMCYFKSQADVIINTSCEHMTQEQYDRWLLIQPNNALIILQSNNFFDCEEHIRSSMNLEEFIRQSHINIIKSDLLKLPKYDRYIIIGKKYD